MESLAKPLSVNMDKQERYQKIVKELSQKLGQMTWSVATQSVPGVGSLDAKIMFIGEAPGAQEDIQGEPFVGSAGKLLSQLLAGIGLERQDVYITNVVKYRPPDNRDPLPEEVAMCQPFLAEEIELVDPRLIILLGRHAMRWFFPQATLSEMRGKAKRKNNILYFTTYHPAAALYNPNLRTSLQEDFLKISTLVKELEALTNQPKSKTLQQDSLF
jgi:DNA polymerase